MEDGIAYGKERSGSGWSAGVVELGYLIIERLKLN
jgi:hypothetical protein